MYKLVPSKKFIKQIKKYSKKFNSLSDDLKELYKLLSDNPKSGVSKGNNIYKIRLKNSDLQKGKSAGYRIITYVIDENKKIYLLTIYSKNELENIADQEIIKLIKEAKNT